VIVRPAARISLVDGHAPFEVVLPSGVIVRVPASFDAGALERVLGVLRTDAC
jgi:hypothetical protein